MVLSIRIGGSRAEVGGSAAEVVPHTPYALLPPTRIVGVGGDMDCMRKRWSVGSRVRGFEGKVER